MLAVLDDRFTDIKNGPACRQPAAIKKRKGRLGRHFHFPKILDL
jgi:hypothetical protein